MGKTEAERRAHSKYAQTPKGKEALMKAHKKRTSTEEYRAYQREKQKEYRQRRKLEASGDKVKGAEETSTDTEVNPTPTKLRRVSAMVPLEIEAAVRSLPNSSDWLRRLIMEAVQKELLQDQDGSSGGAA